MIGFKLAFIAGAALAAALPNPQVLADTCPRAPGETFSVEGHLYQVHCNKAFEGKPIGGWTVQVSYANCAARCSYTPNCAGAVYSTISKHCAIYSALDSSRVVPDTHSFLRADFGKRNDEVVNSPTIEARQNTGCPAKTGETLSINGKKYTVQCDTEYPGKTIGGVTKQPGFANCATRCGLAPGCKVAQYNVIDKQCVLYSSTGIPKGKPYSHAFFLVPSAQEVEVTTEAAELEARQV